MLSFDTIVQYVDAQFEKYLKDESGLNRRNIVDSRVHCCFYFISPAVHGYSHLYSQYQSPVIHQTCLKNDIDRFILQSFFNSVSDTSEESSYVS